MMITSSEPTIARWRFAGGAIGKRTSARPRRTCISLFMITGHAPRSTHTSATAWACSSLSSSQMIVTTSPSSTEKQTSTISAASFSRSLPTVVAISHHPFSLGTELRKHLGGEPLHLVELVDGAEAADEVVDPCLGERPAALGDLLACPHRPPVGEVHRLGQLRVVLGDVVVERRPCLLLRVAEVHRDLVRDDEAVEVGVVVRRRRPQPLELLDELFRMLRPAARHPAVAVAENAARRGLQPAAHHIRRRVSLEARVGDDPDRRRRLERHQRPHLGAGEEAHVVVMKELAVERDRPLAPQRPDDLQTLLEDRAAPLVVEAERLELAPYAFLGVADAGAE